MLVVAAYLNFNTFCPFSVQKRQDVAAFICLWVFKRELISRQHHCVLHRIPLPHATLMILQSADLRMSTRALNPSVSSRSKFPTLLWENSLVSPSVSLPAKSPAQPGWVFFISFSFSS